MRNHMILLEPKFAFQVQASEVPIMKKTSDQLDDKMTCSNPMCICLVVPGEEYCCPACSGFGNKTECTCSHEACAEEEEYGVAT